MAGVTERIIELIRSTVEEQGVSLWDVRFVKEGASHYLRIFIDKPEGISIDDCTKVSHAIDPILDEADPIDGSYYLEVCSPGIERELTREEHFAFAAGKPVTIRLFRPIDGQKEFTGILQSADKQELVLGTADGAQTFARASVAKAMLADE